MFNFQEENFVEFIENQERISNENEKNETFWNDIQYSEHLHYLTNETWSSFVKEHSKVLITIYSIECPNCQNVRSELAKCAKTVKDEEIPVKIAVIDGNKYASSIPRLWTTSMGTPTIFWYKNGIKQFEYIKSRSAEDLIKFIKNPKKPEVKKAHPDWSMQESADDIYHLEDQGFDRFAKDQPHMMVLFYSPGCQACFNVRSQYEEAATRLDDIRSDVTLAAVNIAKARTQASKYDVTSFPYFAYFKDGKFMFKYTDKPLADDIVEFMQNPKPPAKSEIDDVTHRDPESNVTSLTEDNFEKFMKSHSNVLVMFSTPWCGHCRHFKPKYEKAADALKADGSIAQLASINGNEAKNLLKEFNIYGFPTLLYFQDGKQKKKYKGQRTADSVVNFMKNATSESTEIADTKSKVTEDEILKTKPAQVTSLNETTFYPFIESTEHVFIMLYAPWCGACKKSKDAFFQAALEVYEELDYCKLAVLNADKLSTLMKEYNLTGYPSFLFFKDGEFVTKYSGSYDKRNFVKFLNDPPKERVIEEVTSSSSSTQWISEVDRVEHPNIENFDQFIKKYTHVLVFFYINGCEVCLNQMKPEYVKAAETLRKERPAVRLAAINGAWERQIMRQYGVDSFPTILYFRKGKMKYKYHGDWKADSLVKFMKDPKEELAKKRKPTSWQDITGVDFGSVIHLGNKTYDQFVAKKKHSLVMFHSLYFSRCVVSRDQFRIAAQAFSRDDDVGFGAVDCHRQPEQGLVCYHLDVKKFPSYKYYTDGVLAKEPQFETATDIIEFVRDNLKQARSTKEEL